MEDAGKRGEQAYGPKKVPMPSVLRLMFLIGR